jgi:hypothetical protein
MGWIEKNYSPVAVFGVNADLGIQIGDPPFFIKCYRLNNSRAPGLLGPVTK